MKKRRIAQRVLLALLCLASFHACTQATQPTPVVSTETQYERYVEHYDSSLGPLESWLYDSDGSLLEYSVFGYTDSRNTEVLVYSSDKLLDETTLVSKILYSYDADGNLAHGEFHGKVKGVMTRQVYYDATYNPQGYYLDYLEKDGSDAVLEHRVCAYDASGENYLTESYYSDAGTANKTEEYRCTYDAADTWKWLREDHYYQLGGGTGDVADFQRNMVYKFTWEGDNMYLQSDFDESGDMVMAIMYTFEGYKKMTRSCLNQDGRVILYRTYGYDTAGKLIKLCYYNYNNSAGNELEIMETYRRYKSDATRTKNDMYEKKIYTYNYADKSVDDASNGLPGKRLGRPEKSHHGTD